MRLSMEHMEMDTRILNTAYTASKMDSSEYNGPAEPVDRTTLSQ